LPEITISILDCLGVRRSGYGGRLALVNMELDWPAYGSQHATAWNWNVGVISPPLSPAGSHCR
jgi:hypothetical protein